MIPFPLPPVLAHLHELLEGYTEHHERGFFMAEQDRNHEAQKQPVLMFLSPHQLNDEKSQERRSPAWMGEVILADQAPSPERIARYARAKVLEFWRVFAEADGYRIEIHREPDGEGAYGALETYRGAERVRSSVFSKLELAPGDLPTF